MANPADNKWLFSQSIIKPGNSSARGTQPSSLGSEPREEAFVSSSGIQPHTKEKGCFSFTASAATTTSYRGDPSPRPAVRKNRAEDDGWSRRAGSCVPWHLAEGRRK